MKKTFLTVALSWALLCCSAAKAQDLKISIENLASADGFFLTPLWVGLHDGLFDLFDTGSAASAGLELLAEAGDASTLSTEFAMPGRLQLSDIGNPDGFGGAPVIDPGETATGTITPINPASYPYLSFASMVIPSNDAFIGNGNPQEHLIFNGDGTFAGPVTIDIFGSDIWDAGTEVNDTMGAAFSTVGGSDTDEGGTVHAHMGLDNFEGTGIPGGGTIGDGTAPDSSTLVARITITQVPEPATFGMLLLGVTGLLAVSRRRHNV